MSLTPPTAITFKARYPEFAPVSDILIDLVLAEAPLFVDGSWIAAHQVPAMLAWAAHVLALEGEPQRSIGDGSGGSGAAGNVSAVKVGDVQVSFKSHAVATSAGGAIADSYMQTAYGQAFMRYLQKSSPAVAVV